jgi:hypothetical protein
MLISVPSLIYKRLSDKKMRFLLSLRHAFPKIRCSMRLDGFCNDLTRKLQEQKRFWYSSPIADRIPRSHFL